MKIAHIVSTYPPYYGGMGNVVSETASALNILGHEVVVYTAQYYEPEEIKPAYEEPIEIHTSEIQEDIDYARRLKPALKYGNAAYIPQIKRELNSFDIVHLHYPFFGTANLVRKWKLNNPDKPLVVTYHMDTRSPGWKGLFFKYYAKFWMPKILKSADKLIGSSFDYIKSSDAGWLLQEQEDKWVEISFGVDTDRFAPREHPINLFSKYNLDTNAPTVIFVGGMDEAHYFKGIPVLLQALYILKRKNTPVQAVLVGDGNLRSSFELQARGAGLENLVHFVGKVSNKDLPLYYNMGDLCVLPSINQGEAFGMVLLEAMASGVPVVASDLPGVRSVAIDGGMVVAPDSPEELAEAITGYFVDDIDKASWKKGVRAIVEEKYTWGHVAEQLDEVYKELVS